VEANVCNTEFDWPCKAIHDTCDDLKPIHKLGGRFKCSLDMEKWDRVFDALLKDTIILFAEKVCAQS
jgi:hypothetical protein